MDLNTRAAELFLAATVEAIDPDTPAPVLLRYVAGYRAHLAAVIEASHRDGETRRKRVVQSP